MTASGGNKWAMSHDFLKLAKTKLIYTLLLVLYTMSAWANA